MNRPIRVLELRSVRGTGGGPEKTIMLGAAGTDPTRFSVTVCYIRDRRDDVFTLDHRAKHLGIDYVEVLESHSFDRSIIEPLRQLLRSRQIDIVHSHDYKTNLLALLLARLEKIVPSQPPMGGQAIQVANVGSTIQRIADCWRGSLESSRCLEIFATRSYGPEPAQTE